MIISYFTSSCLSLSIISQSSVIPDALDEWAVEIPGGNQEASKVAQEMGLKNAGQIGSLEDTYLFVSSRLGIVRMFTIAYWHGCLNSRG